MAKLALLPQEMAKGRIVEILRETLERAEAGDVRGLFMLTEDAAGNVSHTRDGQSDEHIIFSVELIKKRILGNYA